MAPLADEIVREMRPTVAYAARIVPTRVGLILWLFVRAGMVPLDFRPLAPAAPRPCRGLDIPGTT